MQGFLLIFCCLLASATATTPPLDLETRVEEIERLNVAADWRQSATLIEELRPHFGLLTNEQLGRIELVRLRNLGLSGQQLKAIDELRPLLDSDVPTAIKLRAYSLGANLATNVGNYALAFQWLNDGFSLPSEGLDTTSILLGMGAYLYTHIGEHEMARDLSVQALAQAETSDDVREFCTSLADRALVEENARNLREALVFRHRQLEVCTEANDPIFVGSAKLGIGEVLLALNRHTEALEWLHQALEGFEAAAYEHGIRSAKHMIATSLIALHQDLSRAEAYLIEVLEYFSEDSVRFRMVADSEQLLARLAEYRGDYAAAIDHLRRAMISSAAVAEEAREMQLAYMQVQFETQLREQRIALLEAEMDLAEAQVTATRRWQYLLAGGTAAAIVIAVLLGGLLRRSVRERRRYRWLSERDGLTRLYNYQHLHRLGEDAFDRTRRTRRPFTAVVADIDLFKQLNDRYGHAAGDEVLRTLGGLITEAVEQRGIAGRSGGEEFTLLLDLDLDATEALLQRLRERIQPLTVYGHTIRYSLSFGLCQADERIESLEHLIREADLALYQAKRTGRNRVIRARDEPVRASASQGALVVVGSGIQFGRHVSERCLSEIREAEVVLCLADPFAVAMIRGLRPDVINLGRHYAEGKDRRQTYREIDAAIMAEVRAGKRVCAVFYGHPGVFADVPHQVIEKARAEGFTARMEPGISAEACLYADLGLDPGKRGVQSLEATHFLVYDRQLDPRGLVLLWQVALSGDLSCARFHAEREGLQALVDKLLRWYPSDHEVILYEAAQLPIEKFRAERLPLRDVPGARYKEYTTLVIPPLDGLAEDSDASERIHGERLGTASRT